jgi:putative flavoprotein involved in K+ transport
LAAEIRPAADEHLLVEHNAVVRPLPEKDPDLPTRDEFVRYMESYVSRHGLRVRFGVKVDRIDRVVDGWRLATSTGERTARRVIVATGHERAPKLPDWPGHDRFPGRLLHSSSSRSRPGA